MVLTDIQDAYANMSAAERKVADYVVAHPHEAVRMSMAQLSQATGTSDASVLRMCRHVGQSGFYQLKIQLAMELDVQDDRDGQDDTGELPQDSVAAFVDAVCRNLSRIPRSVRTTDVVACADLLAQAHVVYAFGWGSTYAVAFDLAHRLMRMGVRGHPTERVERMMRMLLLAGEGDAFVAISHSGDARHTIQCMDLALSRGAKVVLVTNAPAGEAARHASLTLATDVPVDVLGSWGHTSHVMELVVCDLVLHNLRERAPGVAAGDEAERYLAQFKL